MQAKPCLSPGLCTCSSFCPEPLLLLLRVAASFWPLGLELQYQQHHLPSEVFSDHVFLRKGSSALPPDLKAITSPLSLSWSADRTLRLSRLWISPVDGKLLGQAACLNSLFQSLEPHGHRVSAWQYFLNR